MRLRDGVEWGKCTLSNDKENTIQRLLNGSETHIWETQFLKRKWLALIKETHVECTKIAELSNIEKL